jgi:hypothetical protein
MACGSAHRNHAQNTTINVGVDAFTTCARGFGRL